MPGVQGFVSAMRRLHPHIVLPALLAVVMTGAGLALTTEEAASPQLISETSSTVWEISSPTATAAVVP